MSNPTTATTLNPTSPAAALQRHWLGQSADGDAQILRDFLRLAASDSRLYGYTIPGPIAGDPAVRTITGEATTTARGVLEALYPAGVPLFTYAAALALDAIEATPGINANAIPEDYRFEGTDEDSDPEVHRG